MIATLVPSDAWRDVWHLAAPLLAPAFDHGRDYAVSDAPPRIERGEWGLWIVVDRGEMVAACITEIVVFPLRRKLWVLAYGGRKRGVAALEQKVRSAAEARGCAVIAWQGRRGWLRSGVVPDGARHVADIAEVEV